MKNTLKSANACYHSLQNPLSSSLLSKNISIKIYSTVNLFILLHECETYSLILREEHTLTVSEHMMLRGIFGRKRDEVTGEWRKLHKEQLYALYFSPYITRVIKTRIKRLAGQVARMVDRRLHTLFSWGDLMERYNLKA